MAQRPEQAVAPTRCSSRSLSPASSPWPADRLIVGAPSALARLDRLLWDLRLRAGSSVGRATAGGAAGTAGTAGALAGKGAAVCVSVLCAAGAGTAALVGLPPGIITHHAASHHRHRTVAAHSGQGASGSPAATTALAASYSQALAAQRATSSTRAGLSSQGASTAHAVVKPTRPVTPGSLVATSSATNASTAASQPSARAASTSATASRSEVSTEYVPPSGSSSSSNSAKHGPCVPGSLSC